MSEPVSPPARRRTGPARSLTREQVVDVALEVMSNQGLSAVSFRTVAMRLGVDPKALYTYVDGKDDLLAAMFDKIVGELDVPGADDPRPAADRIVDLLVSLRRALIRNPDLFRMARPSGLAGLSTGPWQQLVQALRELDLDAGVALRVYGRMVHYTLGSAIYARHSSSVADHPIALEIDGLTRDDQAFAVELAQHGRFIEDEEGFATTIRIMLEQRIGES